jgi:hypothetical protein
MNPGLRGPGSGKNLLAGYESVRVTVGAFIARV